MQTAPALPLEKLAAIDARIQAGLPRDRVLADAGVTGEAWERAQQAWFARMANEAAQGKGRKLHKRYHDLLRAQRKEALQEQRQAATKPKDNAPSPPVARLSPLAAQYSFRAARKDTLPFATSSPAAPQRPSQPPPTNASALPFQRSVAPTLTPAAQAAAAIPAEHLDLTRYACLCAELARFPEDSERIFTRYGLGEPRLRAAVDTTWRTRLSADPQLYRTWQEYYQHYYNHWFARDRQP